MCLYARVDNFFLLLRPLRIPSVRKIFFKNHWFKRKLALNQWFLKNDFWKIIFEQRVSAGAWGAKKKIYLLTFFQILAHYVWQVFGGWQIMRGYYHAQKQPTISPQNTSTTWSNVPLLGRFLLGNYFIRVR